MAEDLQTLKTNLQGCQICSERFAATATAHAPRPVVWFQGSAKIVIAGQAPGMRVHKSGKPFTDPSGDRLRAWMGLDEAAFYDRSKVAIVPMAFCFPGYNDKGSDLAPPTICARTWRARVLHHLPNVALTILVGGYAQKWHFGTSDTVQARVMAWRDTAPGIFSLPHPSWRNTGWLNKNPWFQNELIAQLQTTVRAVLND